MRTDEKSRITTWGAVVIAFAVLAGSCGDAQPEAATSSASLQPSGENELVTSDGSATFRFPDSALPSDVKPSDVTVTRINASDLGVEEAELEGALIYSLEPDGLQLGSGAVLTTVIDSPEGYLPQVFHLSSHDMEVVGSDEPFGLGVETVEGVSYVYDSETGVTSLEVPVSHFSSIIVTSSSNYAYFQLTANSGEAVLAQKPDASGVVAQNATNLTSGDYPGIRSFDVHYSDQTGFPRWFYTPLDFTTHRSHAEGKKGTLSLRFQLIEDSVFLRGKTGPGHGTEVLEPKEAIHERPPRTAFGDQYTIPNADFTCDKVGDGYLDFDFELWWQEKVELQRAWDPTWRQISDRSRSVFVTIHSRVKCIAGSTTSSTSSSTTSTTEQKPTEPEEVQIGSVESAVGINSVTGLVDPNGNIWWILSLGEGWSPAQFNTFFSMFFAVTFTGPFESGAYASCQTHDGLVSSSGSRARGEFTPRASIRSDGSVLLESGVNIEELPPGSETILAMVDSGVWEDEGGAPAVFSNRSFELFVAEFESGEPLSDSSSIPVCGG